MLRRVAAASTCLGLAVGQLLLYWLSRPNRASVDPGLDMEGWDIVADGNHNSNTDLIHWNNSFYLAYQTSPFHFGSEKSRLIVRRSGDGRHWQKVAEFDVPREELRDPKFAAIGNRLFLYALRNVHWTAEPYATAFASSEDGGSWGPLADAQPEGWLFWRPKSYDSTTWYVPAYWHGHGRSILLKSDDGMSWVTVSQIYEGERNDETAIEFLADGRMIATSRLEGSGGIFGDAQASTLIALASPPYENWTYTKSRVTRLDGPRLFSHGGRVFAVGRYQSGRAPLVSEQGSIFSRKRTSLFLLEADRLTRLSDLPSAGDTSYAGAVILGDMVYVCYYTSPIDRDYPWIMGMLAPSNIRMTRISLPSLVALAGDLPGPAQGVAA
jgi:hypothetical protein